MSCKCGFSFVCAPIGGKRRVCGGEGESGGQKQEETRMGEAKVMWVCVCFWVGGKRWKLK